MGGNRQGFRHHPVDVLAVLGVDAVADHALYIRGEFLVRVVPQMADQIVVDEIERKARLHEAADKAAGNAVLEQLECLFLGAEGHPGGGGFAEAGRKKSVRAPSLAGHGNMDAADAAFFSQAAADGGKAHFQARGFAVGRRSGQQQFAARAGTVRTADKGAGITQFIIPWTGDRPEFLTQQRAERLQTLPNGSGCADADPTHILTKTVRRLFRVSLPQIGPEKTADGINGPRGGCIHNGYWPVADL